MTDTEKLLRDLLAIPSVNPAFLAPGDRRAGERQIAEFLEDRAAAAGLEVDRQKILPDRWNLLARISPSRKPKQRIMLAPHLDTVGEPAMPDSLFVPKRKDGRLHGRGACDTKGSVAAMFSATLDLARRGPRLRRTEIIFAGLVDEEYGQTGARALVEATAADLALVGEPTRNRAATAHKGDLWLRLETRGRTAHGARPELGRNAVGQMARVVQALETDYARQLKRRRHPLLGPPTVNVGVIAGGTQANIVPDRCAIVIDRRTLPGETERGVRAEIRRFLEGRRLKAHISNAKAAPAAPLETDSENGLVRKLFAAAHQRQPLGMQFYCDAAVLAGGGIPSVVFGPGDIAQAHTADEWISLESLERARAILRRFWELLE